MHAMTHDNLLSVLLVEDAAQVRQRLRALMTETGSLHVVAEAATVAEAQRLFDSVHPEAVMLDLALPDGSGLDVLRHIRKAGGRCLVLVLSNHAEPETRHCCYELGADYVFGKSDEFEQALETLHGLSKGRGDSAKSKRTAHRGHCAKLVVTNSNGLHARTAAILVKKAQAYDAEIEMFYDGRHANAKSILSVLILCAGKGAEVSLKVRGSDSEEALQAITALFASNFNESPPWTVPARMPGRAPAAERPRGKGEMLLVAEVAMV